MTNKKGFTLIELLVVIAIIGILSAIGLVSLNGAREKARDAQRKSDLSSIRTALTLYYDDNNSQYPAGNGSITHQPTGQGQASGGLLTISTGTPAYLGSVPNPPTGTPPGSSSYNYAVGGPSNSQYELYTQLEKNGTPYYYLSYNGTAGEQATAPFCNGTSCNP